jgi:hypothetical protein
LLRGGGAQLAHEPAQFMGLSPNAQREEKAYYAQQPACGSDQDKRHYVVHSEPYVGHVTGCDRYGRRVK